MKRREKSPHFNDNFAHITDPKIVKFNKLHKINPAIDNLKAKVLSSAWKSSYIFCNGRVDELFYADEQRYTSKSKHNLKQYMPKCSHKRGFKLH